MSKPVSAPDPLIPATAPRIVLTQSYWELVTRDYRRNKLAVLGMSFIVFIIFIAVHAPLISSQRPLYIRAAFPEVFENQALVADEALDHLEHGKDAKPEEIAKARDEFQSRVPTMSEHLGAEDRTALEKVAASVEAASASGVDTEKITAARKQFNELFVDKSPKLVAVQRYPAIRALTRSIAIGRLDSEVFFISIFWLSVLAFCLRRRLPGFLGMILGILGGALVISLICSKVSPEIQDNTPYRKMIEKSDFKGTVVRAVVPFGENENILDDARVPPRWAQPTIDRGGVKRENFHWLGTDTLGRDVLARMVYGSRVSMLVGVFSAGLYVLIGIVFGALCGFFGGWIDLIGSRITEVVICFPFLMIILSVQAFLPPSIKNIILTLAFLSWTSTARLMRGEFLRLVNMDFVNSVRALGGSNIRIIFLHILPNGFGPILVVLSFGIAGAILTESSLSFLGFGVPQPAASWGDLLNTARSDWLGLWWLTLIPGLAIFMTLTSLNLIGEGVRDALDPRRDK